MDKMQDIYVYMCQLAQEVQKTWDPSFGHYFYNRIENKVHLLTDKQEIDKFTCIWLPTEYQCFNLAKKYGVFDWRKFDKRCIELYDHYLKWLKEHPTKAICALGAVMELCYSKTWIGGRWEKFFYGDSNRPINSKSI
jgi:hypothetical protein